MASAPDTESRRASRAGIAAGRCAAGRGGEDGSGQAGPTGQRRGALRAAERATRATRGCADVRAQAVSRGGERVRAERGAGLVEALRSGPDRAEVRASGPGLRFGPECCAGEGRNGRRRERGRPGPRWAGLGRRFGLGWVLGFFLTSISNLSLFNSNSNKG